MKLIINYETLMKMHQDLVASSDNFVAAIDASFPTDTSDYTPAELQYYTERKTEDEARYKAKREIPFSELIANTIKSVDQLKHLNYSIDGTDIIFDISDELVLSYTSVLARVFDKVLPIAIAVVSFSDWIKVEFKKLRELAAEKKE